MMKIEPIRATGTQGFAETRRQGAPFSSKVVPISRGTIQAQALLSPPAGRGFALGRKGRQAKIRRRMLEAFFITTAMGTAALIWWSAI